MSSTLHIASTFSQLLTFADRFSCHGCRLVYILSSSSHVIRSICDLFSGVDVLVNRQVDCYGLELALTIVLRRVIVEMTIISTWFLFDLNRLHCSVSLSVSIFFISILWLEVVF